MQGHAAFELACSGDPPSFLVDGEWYEMRRPRGATASHIRNRHDFMAMLDFLDAALTPSAALRFRERALNPMTGLTIEEITDVFTYVLGEVSGMHYWIAEKLVHSAAGDWHRFTAFCDTDPTRLSLDRFLSHVYAFLVRDGDTEGIEKFDAQLIAPPPDIAAKVIPTLPEWTQQAQGDMFAQMAARRGVAMTPAYETFGEPTIHSGETETTEEAPPSE